MKWWTWIKNHMGAIKETNGYDCPKCHRGKLNKDFSGQTIDSMDRVIRHETTTCYKCKFSSKKEINTGVSRKDLEIAVKTGVCPECHNPSFGINKMRTRYHSDSQGNIFRHESYSCSNCPLFWKRETDTGVTENDIRKAKEILRKHELLEAYNKFVEMMMKSEDKRCPDCGSRNLSIRHEKQEVLCRDNGLVMPMSPYPDWMDTKYVKKIIQNKDSKEKLKKILKNSHRQKWT